MADSLRRLVNIATFSILQEKLERWLDDYNVSGGQCFKRALFCIYASHPAKCCCALTYNRADMFRHVLVDIYGRGFTSWLLCGVYKCHSTGPLVRLILRGDQYTTPAGEHGRWKVEAGNAFVTITGARCKGRIARPLSAAVYLDQVYM